MTNDHGPRPSAQEALQALESISDSKQALADHVGSPAWLYPVQGVGMGLFIIGLVLSKDHGWGFGVLAVSMVIFCVLPLLQTRGRMVIDVYTHPASRGLGLVYLTSFALITVAALALYSLYSWAWIGFGAAALALVLTLLMGPAMDTRLARALRSSP